MKHLARVLVAPALLLAVASCGGNSTSNAAELDGVAVTFYPLRDFAERLLADDVEVDCPLPPGEDPIFWQPDPAAIERFRSARVVVSNGAEFEKWLASASLPESRHVRAADGFSDRFLEFEHGVKHSHGPAGMHEHKGTDGHTWLDPKNALIEVRAMETAFAKAFPEHADAIHARAGELAKDLADLDARWNALVPELEKVHLLASHPAYQYVAQRYGLEVRNFDLDPDAMLQPDQAHAVERAVTEATKPVVMLWESEPNATLEKALRTELRVTSVEFSPAENPDTPPEGGYVAIQRANLDRLEAAVAAALKR
ncbi:MAG: metal ABC transporter substrate-binding protein [Planctomycetota bacterium]